MTLRLILNLAVVCGIATVTAAVALAQPRESPASEKVPEFTLGFEVLAAMIPDIVGDPLEDEHYAANGDALQQTTSGLLVWRKADNWTGFTDGARSWVNGPLGLQERSSGERFDWERQATVATTSVVTFRPAGVRGPDQEGYCWTESLSSWQPDAWRCMVGNRIYDPAFSIPGDSSAVVAGASPLGDPYGFRLKLTQPLPARRGPSTGTHAWILELADGVTCGYLTGASTGIEGERANYGCSDGWYVLGDPQPGQVWTAREVQIQVTKDGPNLLDSAIVSISRAWQ